MNASYRRELRRRRLELDRVRLRVVQHDKPKLLDLHPDLECEIDRGWRDALWRHAGAVTTAALGIVAAAVAWAIARAL